MRQLQATDVLSRTEAKGSLAICALNKLERKQEIRKVFHISKFRITFHWGDKNSMWGRFGGGWQWSLGAEFSGKTLLLNCLVFSVMIHQERKQ